MVEAEYYFDLETTSVVPSEGKIISIQLQRLHQGKPDGEMKILSEWEYGSERGLLKEFQRNVIVKKYKKRIRWSVPLTNEELVVVGDNLRFEFMWLQRRMAHHKLFNFYAPEDWYNLKHKDLKTTFVLMNAGFKGHSDFLKEGMLIQNADIPRLYAAGKYEEIEEYVEEEKDRFCEFYSLLKSELPILKTKILSSFGLEIKTARILSEIILNEISPHCKRVEVVGSIRRKRPFVGDLDFVAIPKKGMKQIVEAVQRMSGFEKITREGKKNLTFFYHGEKVNIFLSTPKLWALKKLKRTGSKRFNIGLFSLAKQNGVNLRELEAKDEEDIFRALEVRYIKPEAR